jgi:hypothetical protein
MGPDLVPDDVRLRAAVKQQQRRSGTSDFNVDFAVGQGDPLRPESFKHRRPSSLPKG